MALTSKEYWERREAEALKQRIKDEKEYDREIKRILTNAQNNCQKEIDAFYGKYASKNGITIAEAKKAVKEADIAAYKFKAKQYVKDKDFSQQANEEMALYNLTMKVNRLEMLKANIGLELIAAHDELDKFMKGILKGRTMDELKRQAGILGKSVQNNAKMANAIVNASFKNATFSQRIWLYQDLLKDDLDKLLQSGLIQGKNPRVLAREIEEKFNTSVFNAERLMRTELARVQTEAQKQSFEKNGFEMYTFHANSGCCDICSEKDGKHFKVADMMPGVNAAPMHPHCRCSVSAYEDSEDYEQWLDFLANGGTTEEYNKLKGKPKEDQAAAKEKKINNIVDVEDFESLDSYLEKNYNISVDKSVKELHFPVVKKALTGVEKVLEEFKGLKDTLKKITTSKGGVMSCGSGKINFNPTYFQNEEKLAADCERMSKSGWWVKNQTVASIGAHESAHAIEEMLIQKNNEYMYDWQRIDAWNKCTEAKKIVSQACKNIKKTPYGKGKRNAELIGSISRYANETASEAMAEAFADIYSNGDNANPLSVEIKRLTIEQLETYERG